MSRVLRRSDFCEGCGALSQSFAFRSAPLCEAVFLFSVQRFFVASDMRFLAAALIPRFVPPLVADELTRGAPADLDLRVAHRAFVASDKRRLPASPMPLPRLGALAPLAREELTAPTPSARVLIA
jgi:hypothetical protein